MISRKLSIMELYNVEGGKLRKKDKIAYYKNDKNKMVQVPTMTSTKEEVFPFLRLCVLRSISDVTDEMIEKVWASAQEKKELILSGLQQMKEEAEASGENTYKVIAYVKAIKKIQSLHVPILSGEQAQKLSGIGPGIASVIEEILRHGKLKTQEERIEGAAARQPIIDKFLSIWDVNPKTANMWYNKGYKELEDLVDEKLTTRQKLGIKYYDDLQKKISRETVENAVKDLKDALKMDVEAVGPYRSGAEEVDVIEVLVHSKKTGKAALKKIAEQLDLGVRSTKTNALTLVDVADLFEKGAGVQSPIKFLGICRVAQNYHRININLIPENDIGIFLLFTTGPKNFLNNIKEQAAVLDYRLDKKGLVKISIDADEKIETPTEKSIFDVLGMDYIEPRDRN